MRNIYNYREKMIAETSAWLTWALNTDTPLPRIPRKRVDSGGFSDYLRLPHARARLDRWWNTTLDVIDRIRY